MLGDDGSLFPLRPAVEGTDHLPFHLTLQVGDGSRSAVMLSTPHRGPVDYSS